MTGQRSQREWRKRSTNRDTGVLAVQSILAGIALLLALITRLIGGDVFQQLRKAFDEAINDDSLAEVFVDHLTQSEDTEGKGGLDIQVGEASVLAAPEGATFAPLIVTEKAYPLLKTGKITSSFGYRQDPIRGGNSFHTGIDIGASKGTPLYAPYDGTVLKAKWNDSYGNYIVVACQDGLELWFAHCSALLAKAGDTVRAGDVIARVGSTGDSTGPHVHFMARRGEVSYNPAPLLPESLYG